MGQFFLSILLSLIFFFPTRSVLGQEVYLSDTQSARRDRERYSVLDHSEAFLGYYPTAFDSYHAGSESRSFLLKTYFASFRETREKITAFRADPYSLYDYQLFNNSLGLEPPRGENAWASSIVDWSYGKFVSVKFDGAVGEQINSRIFWHHISRLYAEFRLNQLVLAVGRRPLEWGQSSVASLIFSSNATPMDGVYLSTLPSQLPWVLSVLGPVKVEIFFSRMNDYRIQKNDYFFGYRIGAKPSPNFEMNGAFAYQFAGKGVDGGTLSETLTELLGGRTSHGTGVDDSSNITNRALEADFRYHLRNQRFPMTLYTDQHFEDCCGLGNVLRRSYSYTFGTAVFLGRGLESDRLQLEYSRIANKAYFHLTWLSGWSNDGRLMGHPSGRDSQFIQLSYEKILRSGGKLNSVVFWHQKDRRGRVDRYWIQEFYSGFQESEQRLGGSTRWEQPIRGNWRFEIAGSAARVFQKYSIADYDTLEWALLGSVGVRF